MGPVMALLSTFDQPRVERLLVARPDLLGATTLQALAQGASQRRSVIAAADDLPLPARQVAEALHVLGGQGSLDEICALDPDADRAGVAAAVEDLQTRLLVTGTDVLRLAQELRYSLPTPLGLGRPLVETHRETSYYDLVETLAFYNVPRPRSGDAARTALAQVFSDTQALAQTLEHMPTDLLALLRRAEIDGPVLRVKGLDPAAGLWPELPGLREALVTGLMAVPGRGRLEMPQEVGLALRWPRVVLFELTPPEVASHPVAEAEVAAACGAAVQALLDGVDRVASSLQERPVPVLSSGGIGVKELRLMASRGMDPAGVALVLRLLDQLGLINTTRKDLRVTKAWDAWSAQSEAERWMALVQCWLDCQYLPASSPATERRLKQALSWDFDSRAIPARVQLVRLLALHRSVACNDADWLRLWRYRWPDQRLSGLSSQGYLMDRDLRTDLLYEAHVLGLLAAGGCTPLTVALLDELDVEPVLAGLSDQGEQAVKAQADMTLICTGRPSRSMRLDLDRLADVEQSNAATVWRISQGSLSRAYSEGAEPAEVLALLEKYAGSLPQAMAYLVSDAHRRFGRVVVGTATSYVVVDDDVQLQDALAKRGTAAKAAKAIGLVRIAPGVAVSKGSKAATTAALKDLGLHATEAGTSPGAGVKHAPASTSRAVRDVPVFDLSKAAAATARRVLR